jgi:hypothetical protein
MLALAGTLLVAIAYGQPKPDWRYLGGTDEMFVFYDAAGVRTVGNHYRVWLKGLPMKAANDAMTGLAFGDAGLQHWKEKIASGYVPPVGLTHQLTSDERMRVAMMEEVADDVEIEPILRMFVEVDCKAESTRHLSATVHAPDGSYIKHGADPWQPTAPETNMARLEAALCKTT